MADTHADEDLGGVERPADDVFSSFQQWFEKRDPQKRFFTFVHFYDPHSPYNPPPQFIPSVREPKALYRGEIRYVDSVLGKLFTYLRNKNAWDDTIVILTSDHGEMLREHQEIAHGFFLYRSEIEVPLIVRIPGASRKDIADIVELVDVAPTIAGLTGIPAPPTMQGESLV